MLGKMSGQGGPATKLLVVMIGPFLIGLPANAAEIQLKAGA